MAKLGKNARKFAKKNLPAVHKRQRKQKSLYNKRKSSSRDSNVVQEQAGDATTTGRKPVVDDLVDASLDIFSNEEEYDMIEDGSDSDGFLSEDSSCSYDGVSKSELNREDVRQVGELSTQNKELQSELLQKKKSLEALKQKDPEFVIFLQDRIKDHDPFDNEGMSDVEEASDHDLQSVDDVDPVSNPIKLLKSSTINSWCQMVKEQEKLSLLPSLLNAFHAACHYGGDPADVKSSITPPSIQDKEAFGSILMFMLSEGDQLFRGILELSPTCKMETILKMTKTKKWENVKPMVKSYLKSTLFLLNQFTDADILAYSLTRLRASLIFFAAFPALQNNLIEAAVHLWATGGGALSASSFAVLRDFASFLGQDSYEKCLKQTYKSILSCSKIVNPARLKQIEYLKTSFVELCSIDFQTSAKVVLASSQKLAKVIQLGLQTKKEEALKIISSWEYVVCIDIWVKFVLVNIKELDLHAIRSTLIQVIHGVAKLFAGQRYLPLKVKCIQWLNLLSSNENFIPISSLALDILENSNAEEDGKPGKGGVDLSIDLKLPKHWLKSREYQEESVSAAIELLCAHFLHWSHHISFPELATIPMIRLKQFHDKSNIESLRRTVKRLIDQVEKNIEFVQRKRDEVSFSPKDQASAESFLKMEKQSDNLPFIQYYRSVIQNAATKKVRSTDHIIERDQKRKNGQKRKLPEKTEDASANGERKSGNPGADSMRNQQGGKKKKRKA